MPMTSLLPWLTQRRDECEAAAYVGMYTTTYYHLMGSRDAFQSVLDKLTELESLSATAAKGANANE